MQQMIDGVLVDMTQQEIDEWTVFSQTVNIPKEVSRAQAKSALAINGLLQNVQLAIDSIQDPLQRQLTQIDWDDRQVFSRTNPTLVNLATALGLSSQQIDDLFVQASKL